MKKITLFFALVIAIFSLSANPIDKQKALTVANNFLLKTTNSSNNLTLVYECISQSTVQSEKIVYYYVFNSDNGFIIISGDDAVYPVLAYSTESKFILENQPNNIKKWLENYKQQINYIVTNNIKATKEIKEKWNNSIQNRNSNSTTSVSPLITVNWGQSPYVNDLCPYDSNAGSGNGYHAVTGCPATAMAQIMKYWNYPTTGTGFHSYSHPTYGNLSANFGATTYDWASMPNTVNSTNNAVATLMYHCGVAVEMQYGPHSSGSYVIMDGYPDEQTSEYAYKTYFGYNPSTIQGLRRQNYSDYNWGALLKNELDAGRPIQYAGFGQGGHTFVCDGYDNNDFFHMNWGWSGSANGYYMIDALNPGSGGTGSGAGTYNNGQQAIIGIQPPTDNVTYNIELYDNLTVTPNPIGYNQGFTVHTDISNSGANTFNGDYGAAIFDNEYNYVDFVEIKTGYSLQSGYHYTGGLDFTTTGMLSLLSGTYHIVMFYRPTSGNWSIMNNGAYSNSVQLDVVNSNDIALYSDITISTNDITQNQSFDVNVDIANYGTSDFNGSYAANLYNLNDGSFVESIELKTGMSLTSGYYNGVTFTSSGISADAGTYLLAILHKEDSGNWELSGSQNYSNPIKVIVKVAPLQEDIYENNDTEANAYTLPISFNSNSATILVDANNHIGSDLDYYKLDLPTGYNYTINARVHDSYNSGNGQTYTNDVAWSYLLNSNWSDAFDDVMPNTFTVNNGGNLIFNVSPYFVGSTGTYLLDISISRETVAGIDDISNANIISIYPNPASEFVTIKSNNKPFDKINIYDLSGKKLYSFDNNKVFEAKISVKNLANGTYILTTTNDNNIYSKKIIIQK